VLRKLILAQSDSDKQLNNVWTTEVRNCHIMCCLFLTCLDTVICLVSLMVTWKKTCWL